MLIQFSEFWLRELVNPKCNSQELSEQLSMLGIEVESTMPVALPFKGVVIGKIIDYRLYPNSTILKIFKVDIGKNKLITIISKNIILKKGTNLAIAPAGAILPENILIDTIKIGNEISEGIFCSFSKLLINKELTNIISLPDDAPIGADLYKYLKLDDISFKVNVTPNRSDCLSILGIARDIAAINRLSLPIPNIPKIHTKITDIIPINIDYEIRTIYLARIIKNIDINKLSPVWMSEKLRKSGLKSIDPISDIINYILLELGQPIKIFDFDCIDTSINVRMAKKNEIFVLNTDQIKLSNDTVVIADNKKIISIAGIIESSYVKVNNKTINIFIECAFFNPSDIIGKSHYYKISTESSYRYERGVDYQIQHRAIEQATNLILEICGGQSGPIIDNNHNYLVLQNLKKSSKEIFLKKDKVYNLVGYKISDSNITDIFKRLQLNFVKEKKLGWQVKVPSWRFDLCIEEDLIEEILRIYGYNNLYNIDLQSKLLFNKKNYNISQLTKTKTMLTYRGYQEIITYSFIDPKYQLFFHTEQNSLIVKNPISKEMSAMRLSILSGLISVAVYNQNRKKDRICLLESGICFLPDKTSTFGVRQEFMLSALLTGNYHDNHWDSSNCKKPIDFYDIKGDLELVLELNNQLQLAEFKAENNIPGLHPGQSALIYLNNEKVGIIGAIHPEIEKKMCLKSKTFVFEVFWNKISNSSNNVFPIKIKNISKYPINYRDISFFINKEIPVQHILNECKKFFKDNDLYLFDINVFDIYQTQDCQNYKSVSFRITIQHMHKTLKEIEISEIIEKCIKKMNKSFKVILRDK